MFNNLSNLKIFNKFWVALATAFAVFMTTFIEAGLSISELTTDQLVIVGLSFLGTLGVYRVPNGVPVTTIIREEQPDNNDNNTPTPPVV